jgi:L-lactate dehydrogenase complex protein LldE
MIQAQLFITCLGDLFFEDTLRHMVELLAKVGVEAILPEPQACCGQPLLNNGFVREARGVAANWLRTFGRCEHPIICPSASCVDTVRHHFEGLFPVGSAEHALAAQISPRVFEFTEFLVRKLGITDVGAYFPHKVTYHASCHYLRALGLSGEAKTLLRGVRGLEFVPMEGEERCCGFGGAFAVTYPHVSRPLVEAKVRNIVASGAEAVVICEPGCLMNIAGGLRRAESPIRAMHIIDILASE